MQLPRCQHGKCEPSAEGRSENLSLSTLPTLKIFTAYRTPRYPFLHKANTKQVAPPHWEGSSRKTEHGPSLATIQVTLVVMVVGGGVSLSLRLIFLTSTVEVVFTGGLKYSSWIFFSHMCSLSPCQLTEDQQQPCHNLGVTRPQPVKEKKKKNPAQPENIQPSRKACQAFPFDFIIITNS